MAKNLHIISVEQIWTNFMQGQKKDTFQISTALWQLKKALFHWSHYSLEVFKQKWAYFKLQ